MKSLFAWVRALHLAPRVQIGALTLLTVALCAFWNTRFGEWTTPAKVAEMNDIGSIVDGFRATPNLFPDGMRWFSGPWIQGATPSFRPVSSILLWLDCWLGENVGWLWVALVGLALFAVDCLLCVALAWRLTGSRACALFSALLVPQLRFHVWAGIVPEYWLAWFPVHHDLLFIGFLLGAMLAFDAWLQSGRRAPLIAAWTCFLLGALSKEFVYIFPLMALALTFNPRRVEMRARAWRVCALMLLAVIALVLYRRAVLPSAYNPPPLKRVHFLRKPWLFGFAPFYRYVPAEVLWPPGLAALLCFLGVNIAARRSQLARWRERFPALRYVLPVSVFGVILLYLALTIGVTNAFWFFVDGPGGRQHAFDLIVHTFLIYALWLLWKYRRDEPGATALALLALSYVPVFTYLGWHYTLAGWFVRCAIYWPLIAKLVWRDAGDPAWRFVRERWIFRSSPKPSVAVVS